MYTHAHHTISPLGRVASPGARRCQAFSLCEYTRCRVDAMTNGRVLASAQVHTECAVWPTAPPASFISISCVRRLVKGLRSCPFLRKPQKGISRPPQTGIHCTPPPLYASRHALTLQQSARAKALGAGDPRRGLRRRLQTGGRREEERAAQQVRRAARRAEREQLSHQWWEQRGWTVFLGQAGHSAF